MYSVYTSVYTRIRIIYGSVLNNPSGTLHILGMQPYVTTARDNLYINRVIEMPRALTARLSCMHVPYGIEIVLQGPSRL